MSEYNKELRDWIEQNLRIYVYPHFDSDDILCVLREIDHLNAKIAELEQENACLREELRKLKSKEKPIRFGSLADWRRE